MKRRVLIIIRHPVGGIRTFLRYVYAHFDPRVYALGVIVPEYLEQAALQNGLSHLSPTFYTVPGRCSPPVFLRAIFRAIREMRPHVMHAQGLTAGLYAAVASRVTGTPLVLTLHDVFRPSQFTGLRGHIKHRVLSQALQIPRKVHCVSADVCANLREFFPDVSAQPDTLAVIPNGIQVERFGCTAARDLRGELRLSSEVFLLGFFGRFMPQKGFAYLREAVRTLSRLSDLPRPFCVVTFSNDGYYREEAHAVTRDGLEPYFRFLPFIPDIASTLSAIDAVVVPSLWEACPLLPMEAMVAGRSVIGTTCIGLREILQNTPSRTCPPADATALAAAIRAEIETPTAAAARAFQAEATRRFDVSGRAREIEQMLCGVMATHEDGAALPVARAGSQP